MPIYGSGGFTSYDDRRLASQLVGWVERDECRAVKMKIGSHPDDDLRRVRGRRKKAIGHASLFVDANGAYSVKEALRLAEPFASEASVAWFEEPVSSDDLDGLAQVRGAAPAAMDIAAGEYAYNVDDIRRNADAPGGRRPAGGRLAMPGDHGLPAGGGSVRRAPHRSIWSSRAVAASAPSLRGVAPSPS